MSDERLRAWGAVGAADAAARGIRVITRRVPELAPVLVHGDCHTENIVRSRDGAYQWIDWQEAHRGDGLADLVFLWQRAEFAGARPPRAAMMAAYAHARRLDQTSMRPLIDQAELRLLLHSWPPFLGLGTSSGREVMRRRLVALTNG